MSKGQGVATGMGNTAGRDSNMLDSRSGSESAIGAGGASSSGVEDAQELSEKVWQVVVEGVQPFMQWELQSGMGDFWEQVCPLCSLPYVPMPSTCNALPVGSSDAKTHTPHFETV